MVPLPKQEVPKASAFATGINLANITFGGGILSLPWAMAGSGLVSGVLIIFFGLILNGATTMIFIHVAENHKRFDTGFLATQVPGPLGTILSYASNLVIWVGGWACLVSYSIIFADSLVKIQSSFSRWICVLSSGILAFPLSLLPQKYLGFTSSLSVIVNIFLFVVVIKDFYKSGLAEDVCIFGTGRGSIAMLCAFIYSTLLQYLSFPMYEQLEDATPQKFLRILIVSWTFVFIIFVSFTSLAYLTYGGTVNSDVITNFPDDIFGKISRVGTSIVVLCCYPQQVQPMMIPVEEIIAAKTWSTRETYSSLNDFAPTENNFQWYRYLAIAMLITAATSTALFVDSLGVINVLNGAICLLLFASVLPGTFGLYLLDSSFFTRVMYYILAFVGCSFAILGVIFTDNYHTEVESNCYLQ